MVGGLGGRCKFGEALDGCIGESGQDVSEVVAHRDLDAAVAFDDGEDCGQARSGLLSADVDQDATLANSTVTNRPFAATSFPP